MLTHRVLMETDFLASSLEASSSFFQKAKHESVLTGLAHSILILYCFTKYYPYVY